MKKATACLAVLFLSAVRTNADTSAVKHIIQWQEAENGIVCLVGDSIHFVGTCDSQSGSLDRSFLECDRRQLLQEEASGASEDKYDYTWQATEPGNYVVRVGYVTGTRSVVYANRVSITVLSAPPVALGALPESAIKDIPVTASIDAKSGFGSSHITFVYDGKPIDSPVLPISSSLPGVHTVVAEVKDAEGTRFETPPTVITVPERIKLSLPDAISLKTDGHGYEVTPWVVNDIKIVKMEYMANVFGSKSDSTHWVPVGSISAFPFTSRLDLSPMSTGKIQIKAVATTDAGNRYESQPCQVEFVNMPLDAQRLANADAARAEQERILKLIEAARQNTQAAIKQGQVVATVTHCQQLEGDEYNATGWMVNLKIVNNSQTPIYFDALAMLEFLDFTSQSLIFDNAFDEKGGADESFIIQPGQEKLFMSHCLDGTANRLTRTPAKVKFIGPGWDNISAEVSL